MTNALSSFGTLCKIGDGATPTENFTTIAEVRDLNPPELILATEDATNHSSSGATREKVGTLKEIGDITMTISFIPTNATHSYSAGLVKDWHNRTKRNFQIVFPDSGLTTWYGPAYVTNMKPAASIDGLLTMDVTLTPAGAWTLA